LIIFDDDVVLINIQTYTGKSTVRALVDLDFKSRSGRGKPDPSKRLAPEDIPSLEEELSSAEETLKDIAREIEFARREELLLRDAGGNNNNALRVTRLFILG
jgi:hypothetical protein